MWAGEDTGDVVDLVGGLTVPEPLEHSVVVGPNEVDSLTDSEPIVWVIVRWMLWLSQT